VAVIDGIGLHTTLHGEDVPPERATAWARRLVELELGVTLPAPPSPVVLAPSPRGYSARVETRARDLDAHGHVDPAVLFTFLEEARSAWLGDRVPDAIVSHVAVAYLRPLGREAVTVTCTLDTVGRASFRTRETVETEAGVGVEAATTLEVPGRALSDDEREALTQ
jgi:acyl-CoA thioesterase FadM